MPSLVLYSRPSSAYFAVVEDLLDLARAGQQRAVDTAVLMLADLHRQAAVTDCPYAKKLQGVKVWELKPHARGGVVGGTRVYFYLNAEGRPVIVSAEVKTGDAPGLALREAVRVAAGRS